MCGAPKVGEVERRTGLGGGYNEREGVEYKERKEPSDDEYDDVGHPTDVLFCPFNREFTKMKRRSVLYSLSPMNGVEMSLIKEHGPFSTVWKEEASESRGFARQT